MQKSRLFFLLEIKETDDIEIIYRAARRVAYEVHPDRLQGSAKIWGEFEPIWDLIRIQRKQGNTKFIFPAFSYVENSKSSEKDHERDTHPHSQKEETFESDIRITVKIKFDEIVDGCEKSIRVPRESSLFRVDQEEQILSFQVSPTPLWLNKDGSISVRATNMIFNKKVVIKGAGRPAVHTGTNGDLEIDFDVDTSGSRAAYRLFQERLEAQIRLINEAHAAKEKAIREKYFSDTPFRYSNPDSGSKTCKSKAGTPPFSGPELNWRRIFAILGGSYLIIRFIIIRVRGY